ncbi:hypothetical protein [Frankia gtarii]|uniref:hypothetical protein n=1 Tax=Frankia gtarii TaxID=2950102 RepID=UPI0021C19649|nr:hypothetical protein [Frankia gtarii]
MAGATALHEVINYLVGTGWQPHVIAIQEANSGSGGNIYAMLAGLGGAYNQPPVHATEGGSGGRGYLLITHNSVVGQGTFARTDLGTDWVLQQWIKASLSLPAQKIAADELAQMRMPAGAALAFQGRNVPFLTWHAPRGPGPILSSATLKGGANPDSYLFLQNSGVYLALAGPGVNNLAIIAADLNITVDQINASTGIPALPEVLDSWTGVSDNLDHIIGHPQAGQPVPAFQNSGNFLSVGTHRILVSTVVW